MLVRNVHASVLRFCSNFAEENNLTVVNFDAHADDDTTLPPGDLIGMAGLSWHVDDEFLYVEVMFGISTMEDTNLFRLINLLDPLYESLLPTKNIGVYDADSGEKKGEFVVLNGTRAMPVGGSSARPLQFIMVSLASTVTF
jgi:hypothetical protein